MELIDTTKTHSNSDARVEGSADSGDVDFTSAKEDNCAEETPMPIATLKELDGYFCNVKRSRGLHAAYAETKRLCESLDDGVRDYLSACLKTQIAMNDRPYLLEFLVPAASSLLGFVAVILGAVVSAVVSLSIFAAGLEGGGEASVEASVAIMGSIPPVLQSTCYGATVVFLAITVPIAIHKLVLYGRVERYRMELAALQPSLR